MKRFGEIFQNCRMITKIHNVQASLKLNIAFLEVLSSLISSQCLQCWANVSAAKRSVTITMQSSIYE